MTEQWPGAFCHSHMSNSCKSREKNKFTDLSVSPNEAPANELKYKDDENNFTCLPSKSNQLTPSISPLLDS